MKTLTAFLLLFLAISISHAEVKRIDKQSIATDYLVGEGDLSGVRLAYRPIHTKLINAFLLGNVDIYWELSANLWEYGPDNTRDANYAVAISPVFTWHIKQLAGKYPLQVEFGIGFSLINDTLIAGKDIGSHYQFEDRLGLIVDFGDEFQYSASVRYMHYSNGGLDDKNPGVDFFATSFAYHF